MRPAIVLLVLALSSLTAGAGAETTLSLAEAIRRSEEHSFRIKAAHYDSMAANFDYQSARSNRMPTLSLVVYSSFVSDLPSADLGLRRVELGSKENYQADIRLSLPLFTGGRLSNQIKLQRELLSTKSLALESGRLKNSYETRKAYLSLMAARSVLAAAEASLNRIKTINADVHSFYQAGLADSIDVLDADLALQQAEQLVDDKATAVRNASAALAKQLGLAMDEKINTTEQIPLPRIEHYSIDEVKAVDIDRPELKEAQVRVKVGKYAERLNSASYLPTLSGFGAYSAGKPNRDMFNKDWDDFFIGGVMLNWEFNIGGKVNSSIQSARAVTNSARMLLQELEASLALQANTALQNLKLAYRVFTVSQREYETAMHKFRLAGEKQKAGRLAVNRLLELEAELAAAEQAFRTSMLNFYIAENDYLYAVGSPRLYGGL